MPPNEKIVAVVVDTSSSMARYRERLLPALAETERRLRAEGCELHFVAFSDDATHWKRSEDIRWVGGGTNLVSPFDAVHDVLGDRIRSLTEGTPRAVIILVSDGDHCARNMTKFSVRHIASFGERCTLLTVAVGTGFPTTTVLNQLRPLCNGGDPLDLIPSLVPLHDPQRCSAALADIADLVLRVDELARPLEDMREDMTPAEIMRNVAGIVNQAAVRACREGGAGSFESAVGQFRAAHRLLLRSDDREHKEARSKMAEYTLRMRELRTAVDAQACLHTLPDAEKQQILALGAGAHHCGRFFGKAAGLKGADWDRNFASLLRTLVTVLREGGGVQDRWGANTLSLQTEREMLLEILGNMAGMQPPGPGEDAERWVGEAAAEVGRRESMLLFEVPGLLTALGRWSFPVLGLTTDPGGFMPDAAQIDGWRGLRKGTRLGAVLSSVMTLDYFREGMSLRQAAGQAPITAVLPITSHPALAGSEFWAAMCSLLHFRNSTLFDWLAYVYLLAGVALGILCSPEPLTEHSRGVLERLRWIHNETFSADANVGVARAGWAMYWRAAGLGSTLVTESRCGGYKCSDIRKALFALFAARHGGGGDVGWWSECRLKLLVEFFGRLGKDRLRAAIAEAVQKAPAPGALQAAFETVRDTAALDVKPTLAATVDAYTAGALESAYQLLEPGPPRTLRRPEEWGLTPEDIGTFCGNMCPGLPPLEPLESLGAMMAALAAGDRLDREASYLVQPFAVGHVDFYAVDRNIVRPWARAHLEPMLREHAEREYLTRLVATHAYVAPILDADPRTEGLDMNGYGLPRNACACPGCPFSYQRLDAPKAMDGVSVISDGLQQHLAPLKAFVIPGLHRTIAARGSGAAFAAAADDRARLEVATAVGEAVAAGAHLMDGGGRVKDKLQNSMAHFGPRLAQVIALQLEHVPAAAAEAEPSGSGSSRSADTSDAEPSGSAC